MEEIFLKLLNMSINASWLVLVIVLLRFILKKAPKNIRVILWSLVGIRLVCPFSFESVLSLIPSKQTIPDNIMMSLAPEIHTGFPSMNTTINPIISESLAPNSGDSVNPLQVVAFIAAVLWIIGMLAMLIYTLVSYLLIRKKTDETLLLKDNIYVGDRIATPFIFGVIKPKIYLPSGMNEADTEFVIAHEKAHIKRRDYLWKPLGFLLLTVYWFNPVMWLAYVLLCRDIELACDEKVISNMGTQIKKPYAEALINCSVPRKLITACPVAFGETGVKGRIKSVLSYKKPALWVIIIAVLASIAVAVGFMTDPKDNDFNILGKSFKGELIYTSINFSGGGTIDMGICDISAEGELEVKQNDHIIKYGMLSDITFTNDMLLNGIEAEEKDSINIGEIIRAYELKTKDSTGYDLSFIFFSTDSEEIYRASIDDKGTVTSLFRLYEADVFEKQFDAGLDNLENAVSDVILKQNKDSFYLGTLDSVSDGMKTAAVESHDIVHYIKSDMDNTWTVYAQMLYEEYIRYPAGNVVQVSAQASPVKIVFKITKDGQYKLKKYVQPNPEPHGMPDDFMEYIYNVPGYDDAATMKKLRADCHDKATSYFGLFSSYSSDVDYALYGYSEQNILIHRGTAFGSYHEPYVLGESVRLRHSEINMSGSIDPEDVDICDYNLTFNEALSGDDALKKLKELCTNFDEEKHMLEDNDLYMLDISISYNDESDIKVHLPISAFPAAVNADGELISTECRFNLKSYSSETKNGIASNWYSLLVPKGEDFKAVYVIGSIYEAPGPTEKVYYDITTRERKPGIPESSLALYQDKIAFDIDNDNVVENCYITAGPTSGIFTFCLAAFHNGQLEYFNIFAPEECLDLSFQINEYTDKLQVIGAPQSEIMMSFAYTYDVSVTHSEVDGDNIRLTNLKYWGEQGIESPWADFTRELQQMEYIDELCSRYPFYFNLPTDKGLVVYVWQMSEGNYQCTLVNDKSIEHPMKIILNYEGIGIKQMKAILENYKLPDEDVVIKPYINPASSYAYNIDDAYQERINALFDR